MSKLINQLNMEHLQVNHSLLVPSIFTERQFELLGKKVQEKKLNKVEQVYFSRAIAKKLQAISSLADLTERVFVEGEEKMIPERKKEAIKLLKTIERNHKGIKILIAGSFLYNKKYNDIDVFLISKYEKEDYRKNKVHFNYLNSDVVDSLFFSSLSKICVANFDLGFLKVKEEISLNQIITKYQEVMDDILNKNNKWLKIDLRDFIVDCNYVGEGVIMDSDQLRKVLDNLLRRKNKAKLINKLFVYSVLNGFKDKEVKTASLNMIKSYQDLMKKYSKFKEHHQVLINVFNEVLSCAS